MRNLTDADRKRWPVRCGDQTVEQLMGWLTTHGRVEVCEPGKAPTRSIGSSGCGFMGVDLSRRVNPPRPPGASCSRRAAKPLN
jgi:hypothetical protein